MQRWSVLALANLIEREETLDLCSITVVPKKGRVSRSGLASLRVRELHEDLRIAFKSTPAIRWAFATLDVSCNVRKGVEDEFQFHFHALANVEDRNQATVALGQHFLPSNHIHRPVRVDMCDGTLYALSYICKPTFWRRLSYFDSRRSQPCWQTVDRALKPREQVELLLKLHRIGWHNRLLMHQVEMTRIHNRLLLKQLE